MVPEPIHEMDGMSAMTAALAPGEPRGELSQLVVLLTLLIAAPPHTSGRCAHVGQAQCTPGQRLSAVRAACHLGLVL